MTHHSSNRPKERVVRPPVVCEHFRKNQDGSWQSTHITDIQAPVGTIRVQTGTIFRKGYTLSGADVVSILEQYCTETAESGE